MRRLHIGMWHVLKEEEWNQFHFGMIHGLEASQYEKEEDWRTLKDFCQQNNISFGIHSPIYCNERAWLPQVTSSDEQKRIEALSWIGQEVEFAAKYKADYILFHYPFPAILPKYVDYNYWPREVNFPTMKWNELSREEFVHWSEEVFKRLVELQVNYKQKIILEYDFFGEFEEEYLQMFEKYKEIQLVIDTQRLDVHKRAFPGFDPYSFLVKAAPYVYLVHHSTTIYGENPKRHVPVVPGSIHNPNYGDAHLYLEFLSKYNQTFHIHFEHNPNLVTKEQLKECYELAIDTMKIKI
ncbi:sugar phosphate isomerase/epimerase [Bacillus sp. FJAT-49736]|uniref:sugar phosphate isomerase/epimerase n=1 Tax=Bacillus sp. FJAT-49736 TaxID=2833582 RepID=UPI001BC978CD|nr:sugar phosphate isomerase/epimerase [Bacillus sp. FJAT-49736]MBS4171760.1 sugar phosphate isomerase/epimerase [Bacillus sp. FJAT-49736]